ncbi:MAG: right-handed parallel beta-helix repeat-containing protein [Verrucomicrobiia bacterium]
MKFKDVKLFLALVIAIVAFNLVAAEQLYFFVSPEGNDNWSGKIPKPNKEKNDGPFATLFAVQQRIRELKQQNNGALPGPVTVYLRGGVYFLNQTFELDWRDSGSEKTPIVYAAYLDEKPIICGGFQIKGWRQDANRKFLIADIADVATGKIYFNQLFINGTRRTRARSPNTGWFRIAGFAKTRDSAGKVVDRNRDGFIFKPGDIQQWKNLNDANIILFHSWENSVHPVKSVNLESNLVEFSAPLKEWWTIGYWEKNQRYIVDNVFEALDEPGEWYADRKTGRIYYYPLPGERADKIIAIAPLLTEIVKISGEPVESKFVSNIVFSGISFYYADWQRQTNGNSSTQAAVEAPCAIVADGAVNCLFEKCEVAHTGGYGIWFRRGCRNCRIEQTRIFDLGAGGVRIGECNMAKDDRDESRSNTVFNNHIYNGGHIFTGGVGIWVAQSSSNLISNNDIHDMTYTGISVGWNWNDAPNRTHHNIIQFNHIHHLVNGVMSDAGGIYTLGVSHGSIIRNNLIHDIWPYEKPDFGWGIYLDATCGNYLVESNIVYYTRSGGLMYNNGGHEHVIRNNIFALSATHQIWPFFEKRFNIFTNNIVFYSQGELFIKYGEASFQQRLSAKESLGIWDYNIYWHTEGADNIRFFKRSFEEWQQLGLDKHSLIADPKFKAPFEGDFNFKKDSPITLIGFNPIDVSNVGLTGDRKWRDEPLKFKHPKTKLPPPPPKPIAKDITENFEKLNPGDVPEGMTASGIEEGASISVTDEHAARGKHSLKIVDSKTLKPSWQPHFFYQPHFTSGLVEESFYIYLEPGNELFTEWRDDKPYPDSIGPSIQFDGNGNVKYKGKALLNIPTKQWVKIRIQARIGKNNPGNFTLFVTQQAGRTDKFENLSFIGNHFEELHWLGFSSTAAENTQFYLDELEIRRRE